MRLFIAMSSAEDLIRGTKRSRTDGRRAAKLTTRHLRADPRSNVFARQPGYPAHVPARSGQSQKFLPIAERAATCRRRDGSAICDPADRPGASSALRVSTNHRGAAPPRNAGQPQTRGADHAGRQSAGATTEAVQAHHELESQV